MGRKFTDEEQKRQTDRVVANADVIRQQSINNIADDIARANNAVPANAAVADMRNAGNEPSILNEAVDRASLPIGKEQIDKATEILKKYKNGKANLETKIVENEQFWKLRHWTKGGIPATAWLWNVIVSKHADAMDGIPEPNVLPREEGDKAEAKILTSIIPFILKQNGFNSVYSDVQWYKLKQGTGVYGVFWDKNKLNGLGDIAVKKMDLLSCYWQPGVTDIQCSRNFFTTELVDNEVLEDMYPELKDKLSSPTITTKKYIYDDTVDVSEKSVVVDWYYKKNENGRTILHYCKFVNDAVLFATENQPEAYPNGLYDHGKYPFVFDVLFNIEGSPAGYSYTDICKDTQVQIDELNAAITTNAKLAAKRRYFIKNNGSVNEEEFADWSKDFIHVTSVGDLSEDNIKEINYQQLSGNYITILQNKIEELKETSGNRDVNNGSTTASVTAASAIAALQEAAGKTSRDFLKNTYTAYEEIVTLVIELIRQFYTVQRQFRIVGERGAEEFVSYKNTNLASVPQGDGGSLFGTDVGYRIPTFDIDVVAQKATAYSKMSQNELALQFFNLGFFEPNRADQALACLDMMDFTRKDFVSQKISQNQTLQQLLQQYMQLAYMLSQKYAPELAVQIEQQAAMVGQQMPQINRNAADSKITTGEEESAGVTKAREQTQASTQVG